MQARLMATLDELDASRNAHQLELKAERRAKERLSAKLDRYLDEVKRADTERDEMREVVSILVEKGVFLQSYTRSGAVNGMYLVLIHTFPFVCS